MIILLLNPNHLDCLLFASINVLLMMMMMMMMTTAATTTTLGVGVGGVTAAAVVVAVMSFSLSLSCLLSQAFSPGISLEQTVIPTAQGTSFRLQYFLYNV